MARSCSRYCQLGSTITLHRPREGRDSGGIDTSAGASRSVWSVTRRLTEWGSTCSVKKWKNEPASPSKPSSSPSSEEAVATPRGNFLVRLTASDFHSIEMVWASDVSPDTVRTMSHDKARCRRPRAHVRPGVDSRGRAGEGNKTHRGNEIVFRVKVPHLLGDGTICRSRRDTLGQGVLLRKRLVAEERILAEMLGASQPRVRPGPAHSDNTCNARAGTSWSDERI
jgi:hypothetical protein